MKADDSRKDIIDLLRNESHLFPKKLHNLGEDFLSVCQSLHDNGINWGYMKLTQYGKKEVNEIIRRFNLKFTEEELSTLKKYIE